MRGELRSVQPKLAMLIPAYNAAAYLPRLLGSARRQTQTFDEIWVYDDCSTDNTAAVAERYGARVVRGEINRGCSHGKNKLAAETRCEWIHFHDADDELMPNFVERAHVWIADGRFDVVLFAYEERDDRYMRKLMGYGRFDPACSQCGCARLHDPTSDQPAICGLYRREAFLQSALAVTIRDPLVLYN